jgi:RNA polymerase sigma factor (sigma-70 family)
MNSFVATHPSVSLADRPLRFLVDRAEPAAPETIPVAEEGYAFADVPRLTAALRRGEEAAFTWLHRQWSGRIDRYCYALAAGDETFAREIAQATWLRLVRSLRVLADEPAFWNWIACAARHASIDLRRKGGRYLGMIGRFAQWRAAPAMMILPDDAADGLVAALESALAQLPPVERALIEGRYFAGETLEAIGARHGLSARAVEGRLARLRVRLRESIAQELKKHQEAQEA